MLDNILNYKFIITGVNGWIGRALIHKLYEHFGSNLQSKVIAFSTSSSSVVLENGFELKTYQYQDNIKYSGSYILCHFAFLTMDKVKLMSDEDYIARNSTIRDNVKNIILQSKPKSIFLSSSGAVYKKNNLYGKLKLEDEEFFSNLAKKIDANIIIPRIFNIGGSFINKHNLYAISDFIVQLLNTKKIVIKANHPVIRSYIHVEDIFKICFSWLLDKKNSSKKIIFDTKNQRDLNLLELSKMIMKIVNIKGSVISNINNNNADNYLGNSEVQNQICKKYNISISSYEKIILDTFNYLKNGKYNS